MPLLIQVWSKNHIIKTVARTRTGPVRKVRADGLHVISQTRSVKHQVALDRGHPNRTCDISFPVAADTTSGSADDVRILIHTVRSVIAGRGR